MFKDIITTIWELPQILIGIIVILCSYSKIKDINKWDGTLVFTLKDFKAGVSFGKLILLGEYYSMDTYMHELGHSKQSLWLGPLYLLVIGLPSLLHNIIYRLCGRKWNYYSFYTEKWAEHIKANL